MGAECLLVPKPSGERRVHQDQTPPVGKTWIRGQVNPLTSAALSIVIRSRHRIELAIFGIPVSAYGCGSGTSSRRWR
jgi:hypothetical protein